MANSIRIIGGFCLCLASGTQAATQEEIDAARNRGLAYLITAQQGAGSWSGIAGLETQTTAAALEAMQRAGINRGGHYGAALTWLANADPASIDGQSRKILALQAAGKNVVVSLNRLLAAKNAADRYTWGAYAGFDTGFPDTPLALSALRAAQGGITDNSQLGNTVYCEILPAQRGDGSWPYVKPAAMAPVTSGAILPTAYTLIELAAIQAATGWDSNSCGASFSLANALANGANWLVTRKNPDGGFGDHGQSAALETALAFLALQAVDPNHSALPGAQDYLVTGAGKPLANGSWANDPLQTALAVKTLPAVVLADADRDGLPDAVETLLGTNGNSAGGRSLLAGNGQAQAGVNQAKWLASAVLGRPFSYSLAAAYSGPFGLAAGTLPDGLNLDAATGLISGIPARLGTFNFTFTAPAQPTEGQISVVDEATDTDIPTLPEWGVIAMGLGLLLSMWRAERSRQFS